MNNFLSVRFPCLFITLLRKKSVSSLIGNVAWHPACQNIYTLTCKSDKRWFTKIGILSWGCNSQISPDSRVWRGRDLQTAFEIQKKPVSRGKWPTSQSSIMWPSSSLVLCQNNSTIGNLHWIQSLKHPKMGSPKKDRLHSLSKLPFHTTNPSFKLRKDFWYRLSKHIAGKERLCHAKKAKEIEWIQKTCNAFGAVHFLKWIK